MAKDGVKDWLEVYMPKKATDISIDSPLEAIEHSLNKWYGLTPSVLKHFGLMIGAGYLHLERRNKCSVSIPVYGASACSLCVKYQTSSHPTCAKCPIFIRTGKKCSEPGSPYETATCDEHDVGPMVKLLEDLRYEYSEKLV